MGPQPYTKNHTQVRKAESRRNYLPQGRAHQFVIQYQMLLSENVHTSYITQTVQVVFDIIYVYTYAY